MQTWATAKYAPRAAWLTASSEFTPLVYQANSVQFDGTNDYLRRTSSFAGGTTTGTQGILSIWVNYRGGDGSQQILWAQDGGFGDLARRADNTYRLFLYNTAGTVVSLDVTSSTTYTSTSGWHNLLISWNIANGSSAVYLYVNGSDARGPTSVSSSQTLQYQQLVLSFGARQNGSGGKLNADVADFYFGTTAGLDLSRSSNVALFYSGGRPVNLGSSMAIPTGVPPLIGFGSTHTYTTWEQNVSGYGDYTVVGALSSGATSP